MKRNDDIFIMGSLALTDKAANIFKGATVVKLEINASLNSYQLSLLEKWKYSPWRSDLQFFLFDESTYRAHAASEN